MALDTGATQLDRQFEELAEALDSLPQKVWTTADEDSPLDRLRSHFSPKALDAAFMLVSDSFYKALQDMVSPSGAQTIESLREKVRSKLGDALADKRVVGAMKSRFKEIEESSAEMDRLLNVPDSINAIPFFQPRPKGFYPYIRLFITNDHSTLADMMVDWGDLSFLVRGLARTFRNSVDSAEEAGVKARVDLSDNDRKKIVEHLEETIQLCNKVLAVLRRTQ